MVEDPSKLGTELNLALATPQDERRKSLDLDVGYNNAFDQWELIVKYIGDLQALSLSLGFTYVALKNSFAIIRIRSELIERLSRSPEIIFIEKPKSIYLEGFTASDIFFDEISASQQSILEASSLTGTGVLVAVIDSGIDYNHEIFRYENGNTRLAGIWDQTNERSPDDAVSAYYGIGRFYSENDINEALESGITLPAFDFSGHGTAVAGIIADTVPNAKLLAIKLDNGYAGGLPSTSALIMAIDFAISYAVNYGLPLVINLSYGNNYGDHGSNSMVEEYIDSVAEIARVSIVTGMGNEGEAARHAQLMLGNTSWQRTDFIVNPYVVSLNLQIWRSFLDVVDIFLMAPDGTMIGPFNLYQEVMTYKIPGMDISVINGYPTPFNKNQETYISIIPQGGYIAQGIWTISFNPKSILDGRLDIWLPVSEGTSADVIFSTPSKYTTMTIPATARNTISVGAYDERTLSYAAFSGRGYTINNEVKPDVSAPGVNITVPRTGGGYTTVSGTSFATPYVSARAVRLMEWGIVNGNDPFLYGEKLKAYLIREASPLPGYTNYPNPEIGWGVL
ncbi:MAG: S8 family serine peptidase [Clostridium sp.]|nr:S8 family serine peptidase [Clostridium sp.]